MIKAILTDIEGTTSSLSFVKEVLFPYSRQRLAGFVQQHATDPAVAAALADATKLFKSTTYDQNVIVDQLLRWIDEDNKAGPLKALQGMIWEEGYRTNAFKGHIYADALHHLRAWRAQGVLLYVFSSGSVKAQKLLFSNTDYGDITELFSGYFDTQVGAKKSPDSYIAIAAEIDIAPSHILFLSDIKEELDAAKQAGMQTTWLVREQVTATNSEHPQATDFDQVQI